MKITEDVLQEIGKKSIYNILNDEDCNYISLLKQHRMLNLPVNETLKKLSDSNDILTHRFANWLITNILNPIDNVKYTLFASEIAILY